MSRNVKIEPDWCVDWYTEFGVSEAAKCAGLYEGHQVKDEVVVGPEVLQPRDVAYSYEPRHLVPCKQETPSATNYPDRKPLSSFNVRPECITQDRILSSDFNTLHRQAEHDIETNEEINNKNHRVAKKNYICNTCNKNFFQRKSFIKHIKIHKACNHVYDKKLAVKSLNQHEILTQQQPALKNKSPKETCKICNKTYNRHYMYRHRLIHTGEKPFSCDTCDEQFRFKDALIKHLQRHSGKPLTCHVCRKVYTSAGLFRSHIKTHIGNKFNCEICDKTLSRKRYLTAHYALHTGEKKFKCEICGTNFVTKRQLSYHKLVHLEKKTFCCDVCGKQLSDKSYLARHLRKHAGYNPKPHVCDICGFKFTTTTRLTIHKRKHTGEKPFSCKICAKQFRHKSTLTSHMRGHTRDSQ